MKYLVTFTAGPKNKALVAIKIIRDIVGGIAEAKYRYDLSKTSPTILACNITKEEADKIAESLMDYVNIEIWKR